MPTSTLNPYYDATHQGAFSLVTSSDKGALWLTSSRPLACPSSMEIIRKLTPPNSLANDHIIVRLVDTEQNATTAKLATFSATLDISIPKDQSVCTSTVQKIMLAYLASMLNDSAVMGATSVNRTALLEGRLL